MGAGALIAIIIAAGTFGLIGTIFAFVGKVSTSQLKIGITFMKKRII